MRRYARPAVATSAPSTGRDRGTTVLAATIAGTRRMPHGRWLVTVACELARGLRTRYLAIPVERDTRGSLAVFALPAVVSGPELGRAEVDTPIQLDGAEAAAIERLIERFISGYLAGGDRAELSYLTEPGARIRAAGGLELVELERVGLTSEGSSGRRIVSAEVRARDLATGATYPLTYRLELVRRDRWYVARVQGALS